jgi:hypothetical protein
MALQQPEDLQHYISWLVQSLNWDRSWGKLRGLTVTWTINRLIFYQDSWGQYVKSLTLVINSVYFTAAINYWQHRNSFIYRSPILFSLPVLFSCLIHTWILNKVILRTQLVFLWNTCPLIKQVLTVSSDHTFNCRNNTASTNSPNNTANRSGPPTVALQSLPVRQFVFLSNSNNSVINSAKHNFVYLTTEHIRYLVSKQGSPVRACRDNCTFCTTQQFNCANFCCAVCHNFCYSYSQSAATFSPLIAPSILTTISILYSKSIIQAVCSAIFTYC